VGERLLIENTLFGRVNKVDQAIKRLKAFEPEDGYWLAFSGGKDSVVIRHLAGMAGVKNECHYSITSVDPPEVVRFIRCLSDVSTDSPGTTMWKLIPKKKMPPTRIQRYCCQFLKENQGKGKITVTGVRWAESHNRRANRGIVNIGNKQKGVIYNNDNDESRRAVENCYRTKTTMLNPIVDWTDNDVWEFIKSERIQYCGLYDEGFTRLGCIGCPMNTERATRDFARWPKYYDLYLHAFQRMIDKRHESGKTYTLNWSTPQDVMYWWLELDKTIEQLPGQISFREIREV